MKGDYPRFKTMYTLDELVEHFLLTPSDPTLTPARYMQGLILDKIIAYGIFALRARM